MFILRKLIEQEKAARISAVVPEEDPEPGPDAADFYVCTLSNKTIVYKVCLRSSLCNVQFLFGGCLYRTMRMPVGLGLHNGVLTFSCGPYQHHGCLQQDVLALEVPLWTPQ